MSSYDHVIGSGERWRDVVLTSEGITWSGDPWRVLLNGNTAYDGAWRAWWDGSSAACSMTYDFLHLVVITEAKWYQGTTASHGTWQWAGSNNGSDWTNIGNEFTWGGATAQTQTELNANETAYRYYRATKTAGSRSGAPYLHEIEFKAEGDYPTSYRNALGSGDRQDLIDFASSGITWYAGDPADELLDGVLTSMMWWNSSSAACSMTFDFLDSVVVREALWRQSTTASHGTWQWAGSNNGSDWTDIGGEFAFGGALRSRQNTLSANETAYRYYRVTKTDGSRSNAPYIYEIEFRVSEGGVARPGTPTLTVTPLMGALLVQTSAFQPSELDPEDMHVSTTYQLADPADPLFASPLLDVTHTSPSTELTEVLLDGLGGEVTYLVRALHTGGAADSEWSDTVTATTLDDVIRPHTPTVTITDVSHDYARAISSAFSHPEGSVAPEAYDPENPKPHIAGAQWQLRLTSTGSILADSGWLPTSDPPEWLEGDLEASRGYGMRVRHWDGYYLAASQWSAWASFTTLAVPVIRPDAPDVTVTDCDQRGTIQIATTAFSHPEPEATHAATNWWYNRVDNIYENWQVVTEAPAELTAYTWDFMAPGEWEFKARHRDNSGRWSLWGEADSCEVLAVPPAPEMNHSGSTRVCANILISWDMTEAVSGTWRFRGELSSNDGASWVTLFSGRVQDWYNFTIAGRPDGNYLFRVQAVYEGTTFGGDWAYLLLRVDRSCAVTTFYDLSEVTNIAEQYPEWEVLWNDENTTWTPVDRNFNPGGGFGILANAPPYEEGESKQDAKSIMAMKELGQPTVFDAEVEMVIVGRESHWMLIRWQDLYSMGGGVAYNALGHRRYGPPQDWGGTGIMTCLQSGHVNRYPEYGAISICQITGCCLNCCCWSSSEQCKWAPIMSWQRRLNPTTHIEYAVAGASGSWVTTAFYTGEFFHNPNIVGNSTIPWLGPRKRGIRITTRHGGCTCFPPCGCVAPYYRHTKYLLRFKATRTVTGGIRLRTQVLGPGLDPEGGWAEDIEMTYQQYREIECGYTGLAFKDMKRWGGLNDIGVVFTSFSITPYEYDDCEGPPEPPEPEYEPSKPCEVVVRCYDDDRETIRWEVGDNPQHPNPYLVALENYGEQELDIVNGAATVGQLEVIIIDRSQTIADQASGWLTERYRLVHGRRGRALRYIDEDRGWVVLADGPNSAPRLDGSYAAMRYVIRDTRETERKVEAFVRGGTTTVFPRGVRTGFGLLGSGEYQVPATEPWPATATVGPGFVTFEPDGGASGGGVPTIDPELIVTPAMREATEPTIRFYEFSGMSIPQATVDNVEIWWRPAGGGEDDWKVLRDSYWLPIEIFGTTQSMLVVRDAKVALPSGSFEDVDGLAYIRYYDIIEQSIADWPAHEQAVEIMLVYVGPPSRGNPMHIEGLTTGELLQNGYDGLYSEPDPLTGEHVPTGIRYHEEDLLQMQDPVRLRLTAPVDDFRAWTERAIYAPTGWVPALDNDGRISPKSQVPPDTFDGELLIDNAVTEPQPEWNAGERVVNVLRFRYPRHYQADPEKTDTNDRIETRDIMHEWRDEMMIDRHDIQLAEYDGQAFAAVGDEWGQALMDPQQERGYGHAENRKLYIFDRYKDGTPIIEVPVMREHCALLRAGDWVRVDLSWFPDHDTGRRGMLCGGQVLAIHDVDCAWRILLIERVVPLIEVS